MQILKLTFLGLYLISCGNEAASFRGGNSSPTSLSNDAKARVLNNSSEDGPNENGEFSEAFYAGEFSKPKPVDIVLAMDTSLSMRQERQALEQNIESFLEDLRSANLDVRITAIGNPNQFQFPSDINPSEFAIYPQYIDSYNAIEVTNSFLEAAHKPLQLRDDAHLEIIFFSDDNASGANRLAKDFKYPRDRSTTINAVVGLTKGKSDVNSECNIANIGTEYMKLADQTAGRILDLCSPNWSDLLHELSDSIILTESRIFNLSFTPDKFHPIVVYKNGSPLSERDFKIYPSSRQLEITTDLTKDDEIVVDYKVER